MVCDIMKMRNVLGDSQTGQYFTSSSISAVGGDGANDLDTVRFGEMEHRATADAVDSDAINEVCIPILLAGADISGEEAEVMRSDRREAKPANFRANVDERAHWKKCYGALWDLKLSFEKQNYR